MSYYFFASCVILYNKLTVLHVKFYFIFTFLNNLCRFGGGLKVSGFVALLVIRAASKVRCASGIIGKHSPPHTPPGQVRLPM